MDILAIRGNFDLFVCKITKVVACIGTEENHLTNLVLIVTYLRVGLIEYEFSLGRGSERKE